MKKKVFITCLSINVLFSNLSVFALTEPVIDYQYSYSTKFDEDVATVNRDEFIDKSGDKITLEVDPERLGLSDEYREGMLIGHDDFANKIYLFDKEGNLINSIDNDTDSNKYLRINYFSEGFASVNELGNFNSHTEDLYTKSLGYIDKTGELVLPLDYDHTENFREGYAVVWNYVDRDSANDIEEISVINTMGKKMPVPDDVKPYSTEEIFIQDLHLGFYDDMMIVENKSGLYGFMDKNWEIVIPCKYEVPPQNFYEDMAMVSENGKFGYINKEGEQVIPCEYYSAGNFSDGYAIVKDSENSHPYYIDMDGNKVFDDSFYSEYTDIYKFNEGLGSVRSKETGYIGCINKKGEVVYPFEFHSHPSSGFNFNQGLSAATIYDEKEGFITGYIKNPYVLSLRIDGKHVMTDTDPIKMEGKTMVPIEETAKYLGIDSSVDLESGGAYFKKGDVYAENYIGDLKLNTNGKKTELSTPIVVQDGIAYMYIRDIADIFGYTTSWESDTSTVVLESI